jgi:hypothetical protein
MYLLVDGTSVLAVDGRSISKTVAVVQVSRVDNEEILAAVVSLLAHMVQERREVTKISRVRRLLSVSILTRWSCMKIVGNGERRRGVDVSERVSGVDSFIKGEGEDDCGRAKLQGSKLSA